CFYLGKCKKPVILAEQNGGKMIYMDQWKYLNWEVGRSSVWRTQDWQLLLNTDRKTSFKIRWVKAHAKGNKPAANSYQKVDGLTKIMEVKPGNSLNPEWYQLGEQSHQKLGHTGKSVPYFAAQSKDWKTCRATLTECHQCSLKTQSDHPAKASSYTSINGKLHGRHGKLIVLGPLSVEKYGITAVDLRKG
uniref:Uncharacterized protein n=1 Tax=Ficedula albicollis TaxID=59894 RepID=A0A803W4B3_FICAL